MMHVQARLQNLNEACFVSFSISAIGHAQIFDRQSPCHIPRSLQPYDDGEHLMSLTRLSSDGLVSLPNRPKDGESHSDR